MKKRKLSLGLILMTIMVFLAGCKGKKDTSQDINAAIGLLKEQNDSQLTFEVENEILELDAKDMKLAKLKTGELYVISYNDTELLALNDAFKNKEVPEEEEELPKEDQAEGQEIEDNKQGNTKNIGLKKEVELTEFPGLVDEFKYNFSGGEKEDTIALYSSAEKDESGELMFDDSNNWLLLAHTAEGDYELYRQSLSAGDVKFHILTEDDEFHIVLISSNTAGFKVLDFKYDKPSKSFKASMPFELGDNVNFIK